MAGNPPARSILSERPTSLHAVTLRLLDVDECEVKFGTNGDGRAVWRPDVIGGSSLYRLRM
jgi:hypothetical protein